MASIEGYMHFVLFFGIAIISISALLVDVGNNTGNSITDIGHLNRTQILLEEVNTTSSQLISSDPQSEEDFNIATFVFEDLPAVIKLIFKSNRIVINLMNDVQQYVPIPTFFFTVGFVLILIGFTFAVIKLVRGVFKI